MLCQIKAQIAQLFPLVRAASAAHPCQVHPTVLKRGICSQETRGRARAGWWVFERVFTACRERSISAFMTRSHGRLLRADCAYCVCSKRVCANIFIFHHPSPSVYFITNNFHSSREAQQRKWMHLLAILFALRSLDDFREESAPASEHVNIAHSYTLAAYTQTNTRTHRNICIPYYIKATANAHINRIIKMLCVVDDVAFACVSASI